MLQFAIQAGASRAIVLSDSRLQSAVRLFESLEARHSIPPADTGYDRGDVYMELALPMVDNGNG
jgi:hypothetical protein